MRDVLPAAEGGLEACGPYCARCERTTGSQSMACCRYSPRKMRPSFLSTRSWPHAIRAARPRIDNDLLFVPVSKQQRHGGGARIAGTVIGSRALLLTRGARLERSRRECGKVSRWCQDVSFKEARQSLDEGPTTRLKTVTSSPAYGKRHYAATVPRFSARLRAA